MGILIGIYLTGIVIALAVLVYIVFISEREEFKQYGITVNVIMSLLCAFGWPLIILLFIYWSITE